MQTTKMDSPSLGLSSPAALDSPSLRPLRRIRSCFRFKPAWPVLDASDAVDSCRSLYHDQPLSLCADACSKRSKGCSFAAGSSRSELPGGIAAPPSCHLLNKELPGPFLSGVSSLLSLFPDQWTIRCTCSSFATWKSSCRRCWEFRHVKSLEMPRCPGLRGDAPNLGHLLERSRRSLSFCVFVVFFVSSKVEVSVQFRASRVFKV